MTFQDIFKSSFLENIASISVLDMVIALVPVSYTHLTCRNRRESNSRL